MRFDELDWDYDVLDGIDAMNFTEMTPVQEATIPIILEGRDIIGCAQTGTGKTAAYTLPLLNRLMDEGNPDNVVKAIIMVPTRELAQQIDQQFQGFSYFLPLSTTVVYGGGAGSDWDQQKRGMKMGSDIVIATPGRLLAHMTNSGIDLSHVGYFILDEADRMLDMGFFDDIMKVVAAIPQQRQTIMFSATLPPKIRTLAKQILHDPAEVNIAVSKPNEAIDQSAYVCHEHQKSGIIRSIFARPLDTKAIVFSSKKQKVKEMVVAFRRMKINAAAMHSDLEQEKREEVMLDFKNGKIDLLVATDIVARGIDIEDIGLVINYDVPRDPEDYIHRIGRTARADATGRAITFVNEEDQIRFRRIEEFIEREVTKNPLPEGLGEGPEYRPGPTKRSGRGNGGGKGRGRGGRHRTGSSRSNGGNGGGVVQAEGGAPQNTVTPAPDAAQAGRGTDTVVAGQGGQGEQGGKKRRRKRGGRRHRRGGENTGANGGNGSNGGGSNGSNGGDVSEAAHVAAPANEQ